MSMGWQWPPRGYFKVLSFIFIQNHFLLFPFIFIQNHQLFNQFVSWSCELNEKKIVWMKVKVFIWILSNFQWLVSCGLAGLPQVPVFSRVGGGEMTQMKVKVLSLYLDLLVSFCFECQCLIRSWGRKYSYDDSINQYIQAFSCSKRTTNKHHASNCKHPSWGARSTLHRPWGGGASDKKGNQLGGSS